MGRMGCEGGMRGKNEGGWREGKGVDKITKAFKTMKVALKESG